MRLRIAEINQHAVAHIFGDIAAEAGDHLGDAFVIGGDDLAQIFRIEPGRQRGRADQIAEHHRDLAALGRVRGARDGRCGAGRGGRAAGAASPSLAPHCAQKREPGRIGVAAGGAAQRLRRAALRAKPAVAGNVACRSLGRLWSLSCRPYEF